VAAVTLTDGERPLWSRALAAVVVLCALAALGALAVGLAHGSSVALAGHVVEDAATALVWLTLAAVIARRSRHPVVWLFLAVGLAAALAVVSTAWAVQASTGSAVAAWLGGWVWPVSTFTPVTLVASTFPSGRLSRRRLTDVLAVAGMAAMAFGLATGERIETSQHQSVVNPLAVPGSGGAFVGGGVLVAAAAVLAVGGLVRRTARASGTDRRRLVPVAVAMALTVPALLVAGVAAGWSVPLQLAVAPLVPCAVAFSILQYRLYDIEVVVRRSVVFGGLTVLVVVGYVLVVQAVAALLHRPPGTLESVIATAVVALAFAPARTALTRWASRSLYGDRDAPQRVLADLDQLLSAAAEPESAVVGAAARLRTALRVPWVEVRDHDGVVTTSGERPRWAVDAIVLDVPMHHLGTLQGSLRVAPRTPEEPLDARDQSLIAPLASLVASVLQSRRLVADLRRSREEVVRGREEERRRIRRDLHDGVGPLLSALVTHTEVAGLRLQRDSNAVPEVLDRLQQIAGDAVVGLRRVVQGLQPAALDELGLRGAVEELLAATAPEAIGVDVVGEPGADLPAAVEVTAYRIVAEAAHNAVRHSGGSQLVVRFVREADCLVVQVTDDGRGISSSGRPGVGTASMRARAEELGGRLAVTTGSGGTSVEARLPVRS
jgi:signal transduction histidine kinase